VHEYSASGASTAISHEALVAWGTQVQESPMSPNRFDPVEKIAGPVLTLIVTHATRVANGMVQR
jgi:hypothetical protein